MPEDVVVEEGIEYPHFNLIHYKRPLRRLKNDRSIRQVPVHPVLLEAVRRSGQPDRSYPLDGRSGRQERQHSLAVGLSSAIHALSFR